MEYPTPRFDMIYTKIQKDPGCARDKPQLIPGAQTNLANRFDPSIHPSIHQTSSINQSIDPLSGHARTVVAHKDEQGAVAGLDAILDERPHAVVHLLAHHPVRVAGKLVGGLMSE